MDTKKCIEFLEHQRYSISEYKNRYALREGYALGDREDCNKQIGDIIKRLQMWEDFKEKYKDYPMAGINKEGLLQCTTDNMLVGFNMDDFEQEYFCEGKSDKKNNVVNINNVIKFNQSPPTNSITFRDVGKTMGMISWEKGTMKFEGDADESAKIFFNEFLKPYVDDYIKSEIDFDKSELKIILKAILGSIKNGDIANISTAEYKIVQNIREKLNK